MDLFDRQVWIKQWLFYIANIDFMFVALIDNSQAGNTHKACIQSIKSKTRYKKWININKNGITY